MTDSVSSDPVISNTGSAPVTVAETDGDTSMTPASSCSADVTDGAQTRYDSTSSPKPAAGAGAAQPVKDLFFHTPPEVPTQEGPKGIRYDFNDGARVLLPKGKWHVRITDEDSGNILFACDADEGWVVSTKKYFVRFGLKVFARDGGGGGGGGV